MKKIITMLVAGVLSALACCAADGYLQVNAMQGTRVFVDGKLVGETVLAPAAETTDEFVDEFMEEALLGPDEETIEPVEPAPAPADDLGLGAGDADWDDATEAEGEAEAEAEAEPMAFLVVGPLPAGNHEVRTERTGQPARVQPVEVQAHALTLVTVPSGDAPIQVVEGGLEVELPAETALGTLEIVTLPAETFVQLGDGEPVAKSKPLWTATDVPVGLVSISVIGADGFVLEHSVQLPAGGRARLIYNLETGDVHNATQEFFADFWFEGSKEKPMAIEDAGRLLWHPNGFWMARDEVAQGAYGIFLKEVAETSAAVPPVPVAEPEDAAAGMSRLDAGAYCQWLTDRELKKGSIPAGWLFRLPTRVEWEAVATMEDGKWAHTFGGVAEWTSGETDGWVVAMGGSDRDTSRLARGIKGAPGRRARVTDRISDVGFRVVLVPEEIGNAGL